MPIMDDGFGPYTIGPDGQKRYATATEFKMNDELVYQFNPETGVLQISADEQSIKQLIQLTGGLPAKEIVLPSPPPLREQCHFHDVKEIKPLPRKDGSFLISLTPTERTQDEHYQSLSAYSGKKTACDNCSRQFNAGEVISVNEGQGLVFCYSDAGGGCVPAYTFTSGKMICCIPMKFGKELVPSHQRTPNYPESPVIRKLSKSPQRKWWQRLFN